MSRGVPIRPAIAMAFEPRFCGNHVVDLTAGCSFGCIYCPFAAIGARAHGVTRSTPMDISALERLESPPSVFLSPASDPFAPQAAEATHALLVHLLRGGTSVAIVTKGIIPDRTLALLADHRPQVEGVAVGVTSLSERRNRVLEPGCPPAEERLVNVNRLAAYRLPSALRLDPLFPVLDDEPSELGVLVEEAASRGAHAITATYVFAWGRYLRRLQREPLLAGSCRLLTERAPMEGGGALSVPLARKTETYGRLADMAAKHGLWFNTCGCKDLRIRESDQVFATCRNVLFMEPRGGSTRSEACRGRAGEGSLAPPAAPRA
jgi:pyruvate-formate lyase-activating enzyme